MRYDVRIGIEVTLWAGGCKVACEYCPQKVFMSHYRGPKEFTLDSFKRVVEGGQVPLTKHFTIMGFCEPYMAKDCTKIMRWAFMERGHKGSISTTLTDCTFEDIDAVAEMQGQLTDVVLHAPANDNRMPGLRIDSEYVERFKYAIKMWRSHPDFVIQVYDREPHPAIHKIWSDSGVHIPCFGLHDRAGLLPDLQGPYVKHGMHKGPLQVCGKQFNGHLVPSGQILRCCNDWAMQSVWGQMPEQTYEEIYHSQKFRDYMKSLQDPNSDVPCRRCNDGYKQCNVEDRNKGYDLIGH